ncbi:MAG: 1-deoxy-D-xylulose-5-phosphate reductoisomerase, partial [Eubacteriales bacterium]|nr:1-deoxy-D-xylulose-5-phosphate reductoisomerase [Eubacteriales bacterium]
MALNRAVAVLGSTGSIGRQTLDVAQRLGMRVASLAAGRSVRETEAQARQFCPDVAALYDEEAARDLKVRLADTSVRVLGGAEGVDEAARLGDIAVNG